MRHVATNALRASLLCWVAAALAGCGGGGSTSTDSAVDATSGVCGTHANPGVLNVRGHTPAPGTSVVNQGILHTFTVEGAPAYFVNFQLVYGPTHTAGPSIPSDPKIQVTTSANNNLTYQFTVDAWSIAPGHVEVRASNGYDTTKGCSWVFPSPLFSYDVTPAPDAGVAGETKGGVDGGSAGPHDVASTIDGPASLDLPSAPDVPLEIDVPIAFDGPAAADDVSPVILDAGVDHAPAVDASIDL